MPIVFERFINKVRLPGKLARFNNLVDLGLRFADHILGKIMFIFVLAGITLSCLHQSSLGTLMVLAPYKMHPLYWSELSPLIFLASAIAVGPSMVIVESMIASHAFDRKPEMHLLTPLGRIVPFLLAAYALLRGADIFRRGAHAFLFDGSLPCAMFWVEFGALTLVPLFMFMSPDIRRSPRGLFMAAAMYVAAVLINRCTVFFIAYQPPYATHPYMPALLEIGLTVGLVCTIIFVYRLAATWLAIIPVPEDHTPDGATMSLAGKHKEC
jgi:Ni/Fe-hydrogenase subunit HybB-like protein